VEIDQMTVEVNSSGHIVLNEEVLDTDIDNHEVPLLLDRLRTYAESARLTDSQPMVIIAADDASKGQRFVDVLNALSDKQVDIRNVTITGFKDE
jgi:biopolymer transport protein ExbD